MRSRRVGQCHLLATRPTGFFGIFGGFGWVLYSVYFVAFPTQVIFLDAEHLPEILFSLVIAAPMNGFVAILFLAFT
jgi:hypothetical protein